MINVIDNLKQSLTTSTQFFSLSDGFSSNRISQNAIVKDGYLSNQDVYAVVSRVSRLCASLPIQVMNGDNEVFEGDEFYDFFMNKWGKESGVNEGLNALFTNLFLFGKAYILKDSESFGFMPEQQYVLPTNRVEPYNPKNNFFDGPQWYYFNDGNKEYKYLPEELTIITFYDPTGYETNADGLSPLNSVWKTVEAGNNRGHAESKILENRGIAGFVSPKGANANGGLGLSERVMKVIRDAFQSVVGGAKNFNKVIPVEEGVDFTQVQMSANDLKLIEMRLNHVRDICNAYGVPSLLFNDYQSRTHANYAEAKKALYTDFVLPMFELFNNQYERKFIKEWNEATLNSYYLGVDKTKIEALQYGEAERQNVVLGQYNAGLITIEEAREMLGKPKEIEPVSLEGIELFRSFSPLVANNLLANMTPEQRGAFIDSLGLVDVAYVAPTQQPINQNNENEGTDSEEEA